MSFAPIVLFAFNRLEPLKRCVTSLLENSEASETDLIVYVDGPRIFKEGEREKVNAVREYVRTISGFNAVKCHFSETNKKLGPSIISGVTDVINKYGYAIVIEDDLVVSDNFLSYINQGLNRYRNNTEVFSVCGYSNKVCRPSHYLADSYFCTRSSSWGWATWKDRWETIDWNLEPFEIYLKYKKEFNKWGGSDCFGMLNDWHEGKNNSWAIRFCFSQFLQNKVSIFPMKTLVVNNGFDGNGTNCKRWSRFKYEVDESGKKDFVWPQSIQIVESIRKKAMSYHSIGKRIYSRIMYKIYG